VWAFPRPLARQERPDATEGARSSGRHPRSRGLPRGGRLPPGGRGPLIAFAATLGRPTAREGRAISLRPRPGSGRRRRLGCGGRLGCGWRLGCGGRIARRSWLGCGGRLARRRDGLHAGGWRRGLHRRGLRGGCGRCARHRVGSDLRRGGHRIGIPLRGHAGRGPKAHSTHGEPDDDDRGRRADPGGAEAPRRRSHTAWWSLRLQGCHPPRSAGSHLL
jgi:hypothetical protein